MGLCSCIFGIFVLTYSVIFCAVSGVVVFIAYVILYLIFPNLTAVLVLLLDSCGYYLFVSLVLGCHYFSVGGFYTVLGCHFIAGGTNFGCGFTFKIIPPFLVPFLQNRRNKRNRRANKRT